MRVDEERERQLDAIVDYIEEMKGKDITEVDVQMFISMFDNIPKIEEDK